MITSLLLSEVAQAPSDLPGEQLRFVYQQALAERRYSVLARLLDRSDLPDDLREDIMSSPSAAVRAAITATCASSSPILDLAVADKRATVVRAAAQRLDLSAARYARLAAEAAAPALPALLANSRCPLPVKLAAAQRLIALTPAPYHGLLPEAQMIEVHEAMAFDSRLRSQLLPLAVDDTSLGKSPVADLALDESQFMRLVTALLSLTTSRTPTWQTRSHHGALASLLARTDCPPAARQAVSEAAESSGNTELTRILAGPLAVKRPCPASVEYTQDVWGLDERVSDEQVNALCAAGPSRELAVANAVSASLTDAQFAAVLLAAAVAEPRRFQRWAPTADLAAARRLLKTASSSPMRTAAVLLAYPVLLADEHDLGHSEQVLDCVAMLLARVPALRFPFSPDAALATGHTPLLLCMPAEQLTSLVNDPRHSRLRRAVFELLWNRFGARQELWASYTHLARTMKDRSAREVADAVLDAVG